jgi:hypothetical protein
MRTRLLFCLASAALAVGCADDAIECSENADCVQGGIPGTCEPSPASEHSWCAFTDSSCTATGKRWGARAGDGLAKSCLEGTVGADAGPDGSAPDAGADEVWSRPTIVANVNSAKSDMGPCLSSNGLELFFSSYRDDPVNHVLGEIYVATRGVTSAPFETVKPLSIVNTGANELAPDITADGKELFFERVGQGIMVTKRSSPAAAWGAPVETGLNGVRFPSISADGLTLYLSKSDCQPGCLVKSTRANRNAAWGDLEAVPLPGGLVGYDVADISGDGRKLLLYGGSTSQAKVLIATRPSEASPWTHVDSIPNISFGTTHSEPSWGFEDREIYMAAKYPPPDGVGEQDIFVSALQ